MKTRKTRERKREREGGKGKVSSEREVRRKGKEGGRENWEEKEESERETEVILGDGKDLLVIALPYGTLHGGGALQSGMFTVLQYASTEPSSTVQSTGYKVQGVSAVDWILAAALLSSSRSTHLPRHNFWSRIPRFSVGP